MDRQKKNKKKPKYIKVQKYIFNTLKVPGTEKEKL